MRVLSILISLTYSVDQLYKQADVHRFDRSVRRHGKPPSLGVPKHDVAGSVLVMIDTQPVGDDLQVLNPPVTRVAPHFGDEFRRVRHDSMVPHAVPRVW